MNASFFPTGRGRSASLLGLLLATWAGRSEAQTLDLAHISGGWAPRVEIGTGEDVVPLSSEVQIAHVDAGVRFPIPIVKSRTVLLAGFDYGMLALRQVERQVGPDRWREFHAAQVSFGLSQVLSPEWSLLVQGALGLSGDFVEVNDAHFRWGLTGMVRYRLSDALSLGAGIVANWQFGELTPLPGLLVDWRPLPSLEVSGLLPARVALTWTPIERFELGLLATIRGNAYALTSVEARGGFPCEGDSVDDPSTAFDDRTANPELCLQELAYSRGEVGPTLGLRVFGPVWLTARVSFLFFRRYEFVNEDGDSPPIGDLELPGSVAVEAGLRLRIPQRSR